MLTTIIIITNYTAGTDSRFGWGFRLGNRADFQVLVELGPQTNTQPLGNQQTNTNSKRSSLNTLTNVLYAQRQHEKTHISNTDGGKWLQEWNTYIRAGRPNQIRTRAPIRTHNFEKLNEIPAGNQDERAVGNPVLGIGEIDAKSVIPEDKDDKIEIIRKTSTIATTTSKEDALDNVAIDD
ncbi:wd repeat domain 62 isoform g [Holotrichia oblita]|uniref:Wd repeat domain 62 isoform g n=1 Tax=Holotrichia oblita TaxID=644536 RepID=A0ACB9SJZ5_HOLOL|nr:wd repeat domain 62 isoform g [Holotrichia oblita]